MKSAGGDTRSLLELQQEYQHEYNTLAMEQKEQLVSKLLEEHKSHTFGARLTQKSIIKDIDNMEAKMKELVHKAWNSLLNQALLTAHAVQRFGVPCPCCQLFLHWQGNSRE